MTKTSFKNFIIVLACGINLSNFYASEINDDEKSSSSSTPIRQFKLKPDAERESLKKLRQMGAAHMDINSLKGVFPRSLPSSVDLSTGFSEPPYNQGDLGSCTANALVAAVNFDQDRGPLSRLFLYAQERLMEHPVGTDDSDSGASLSDGILALRQFGVCEEQYWPYSSSFKTPPLSYKEKLTEDQKLHLAFENWTAMYRNASECRLANLFNTSRDLDPTHTSSVARDLSSIKLLLSLRSPVVGGILLYDSFMQIDSSGIVSMPKSSDALLGGHAIVFAGYDDNKDLGNGKKGALFIRNSWGTDWGTNFAGTSGPRGYFWLPYEYFNSEDQQIKSPRVLDLWKVGKIGQTASSSPSVFSSSSSTRINMAEDQNRQSSNFSKFINAIKFW